MKKQLFMRIVDEIWEAATEEGCTIFDEGLKLDEDDILFVKEQLDQLVNLVEFSETLSKTKKCSRCGEDFNIDRSAPDGLYSWCKDCSAAVLRHLIKKG